MSADRQNNNDLTFLIPHFRALARKYFEDKKFEKAENTYKKIIQLYKQSILEKVQTKPIDFAANLKSITATLASLNISAVPAKDVEALIPTVQEISNQLFASHPMFLELLKELAYVYEEKEEYDEALSILNDRYMILSQVYGKKDKKSLIAWLDIAHGHHLAHNFAAAELIYQQCLHEYQSLYGIESISFVEVLQCLGGLFYDQQNYAAAASIFHTCYSTRRSLSIETFDLKTYEMLYLLGKCEELHGNIVDAEQYYLQCITQLRAHLSSIIEEGKTASISASLTEYTNGKWGKSWIQLGELYFTQQRYVEAENIWKEAYQFHQQLVGDENNITLSILCNHAICLEVQGNYQEAMIIYESFLAKQILAFGPEDEDTLMTMNYLNNLKILLNTNGIVPSTPSNTAELEK
jgi:tetratricopeptide (TPR) repeat protein